MKTSKFQITVLIVFIIFIIAGVAGFATYKGSQGENQLPPVTIWGTFPKEQFDQYVSKVNNGLTQQMSIKYTEYKPENFLSSFVAALARGAGPDVILVSSDMLLPAQDKLVAVPYSVFPQRSFMNQFIDEARVYLSTDGILGIPFSVDPMVMYWNRDLFNTAGIAVPPKYWDEFKSLNQKLTVKDENGTVSRSAAAMGDFSNVANAREILGSIILQSGNPVTAVNSSGLLTSALKPTGSTSPVPAFTFFTQFVDPGSENYSWNRSWPDSRTAFISGKLATYFGFASELFALRNKNPNLNYDVSPLPQFRSGGVAATYGRMHAFSITRQSRVANAAFQMISTLTHPQFLANLSADMYLPSVSRDIIAAGTNDPYIAIFNQAALISKTWRDTSPVESNKIFASITQAITTGRKSVYQALTEGSDAYDAVLRNAISQ